MITLHSQFLYNIVSVPKKHLLPPDSDVSMQEDKYFRFINKNELKRNTPPPVCELYPLVKQERRALGVFPSLI